MKLTTNLATRRYINLPQLNAILLAGFTLFLALALFKVWEIARNAAEISRIRSQNQGLVTRSTGEQVSEGQLKLQRTRIQFANAAIDKKAMNWIGLLDRLEEVVPAGVTLTEIMPDMALPLKLTGVARSFANLRTLLENMESSKNFSEVYLLTQNDTKVGQTQEGLTFSITCKVTLQ
jgi:type IV pilus assembly protein PilN